MMKIFGVIPVWALSIAVVWELIWKAISMWRAARNDNGGWYVCLLIFNTLGILPIIYLLTHKKKR